MTSGTPAEAPPRRRSHEVARLRLAAVGIRIALALVLAVLVLASELPARSAAVAWAVVAAFAAGALLLLVAERARLPRDVRTRVDVAALLLDYTTVVVLVLVFAHEPAQPLRTLALLVAVEGALRFGWRGGIAAGLAAVPLVVAGEWWRVTRHGYEVQEESVVIVSLVAIAIGAIVGRLTTQLRRETRSSRRRAGEAERLRDELGRRFDLLEAANRCARALGSSLELDQAFAAFVRELRGLVPFDRTALVLAEHGRAQVVAAAGAGAEDTFPAGSSRPVPTSVLEEVLRGTLVYREDMSDEQYPEEHELRRLGLRARLCAPLQLGARTIGMVSISRREPRSFTREEVELVSLLGRLVATAVQNIRAYEAERSTVEELRRLSALRADFVSLVSHELRSPMASVIGSARTLQQRWRELTSEQRESFLALIADETNRLAGLVGDVLDTSRIEAGTFSYSFTDVDPEELLREAAAGGELAQDEVGVELAVRGPLPNVRGDRERLKQVLVNLVENALKYSPEGGEVRLAAYAHGERLTVEVSDQGPGIAPEHQRLIFEKFGRVAGSGRPGTGLGLFIARSIVEAHGGSLDVQSAPGRGSTFRLHLPAGRR